MRDQTAELPQGCLFAGYRIEALLGQGGMGAVYRARQEALDRVVALKVVAAPHADDPQFRERFRREARAAASVEHPHVVPIFEADEWEGRLYLAMRLVHGTDLATLVRREGHLEPPRGLRLVKQIASALDAAHGHGLVHRDIKPANVLVAEEHGGEHAYLTDFGIAKRRGSETGLTKTGNVVGTLDYLAPEAFRGEPVGAPADVYALGCVTYEVLTGELPFPKGSDAAVISAHLHESAPSLGDSTVELPDALDAVVRTALAKEPEERFPSAGALAEQALIALEGGQIGDVPETSGPGAHDPRGRPGKNHRSSAKVRERSLLDPEWGEPGGR